MSWGHGRIQRACLSAIENAERDGRSPIGTYTVAADVYDVARDADGNRWVTDAQHVAVRRALTNLQREGRVIGFRIPWWAPHGDGKASRQAFWFSPTAFKPWLSQRREDFALGSAAFRDEYLQPIIDKAKAMGWEVS